VIEAFSQIAPLFEQVYLVIAGPDEEGWTERIQRWAYVQGLQHRVRLTGLLVGDERLAAFADADIFILTSYSESFGISVAEAMAAGLPVLVSNQVGIHPAIRSADAGLVVPLEVSAIAEGMGSLLIRSDLPAMGYRGRQLVRTYFSSDVVASQMIEAYEKILARSRTDHKPIACTKGHI
jgi:glycosyltransferase involved in cell wall biosynthesis